MNAEPKRVELTDDLRERLAKEAFVSDDFGGHHQANGSPFAYSPYTWESIPEDGRANYRRLIGDLWPVIVEHFAAREAAARREALLEAAQWFGREDIDAFGIGPESARSYVVAVLADESMRPGGPRFALAEPERDEEGGND